ncbi:MAG TPA: NAD-binding protein [Candidatus Cryosericum sp.]|nr:NAD-binding protein [Candidatus Cryosericum sp.]
MYIIIAGCGKIGANLVKKLSSDGHDVVVIDPSEENLAQLESGTNCLAIAGVPIDEDVLKSAGIERADALCAVTSDDNVNIMTAQIAKQLYHVPFVVTRVYDPDKDEVLRQMGLCTVCPTMLTVARIGELLGETEES